MPSNESLQQFNESLVRTGNEPEIAAERGEQVEAVEAPRAGEFDSGSPADSAEAVAQDFFSNLSDGLTDDTQDESIEGMPAPDADFLSDLGLDEEEPQLTDFGLDAPEDEDFSSDVFGGDFGLDAADDQQAEQEAETDLSSFNSPDMDEESDDGLDLGDDLSMEDFGADEFDGADEFTSPENVPDDFSASPDDDVPEDFEGDIPGDLGGGFDDFDVADDADGLGDDLDGDLSEDLGDGLDDFESIDDADELGDSLGDDLDGDLSDDLGDGLDDFETIDGGDELGNSLGDDLGGDLSDDLGDGLDDFESIDGGDELGDSLGDDLGGDLSDDLGDGLDDFESIDDADELGDSLDGDLSEDLSEPSFDTDFDQGIEFSDESPDSDFGDFDAPGDDEAFDAEGFAETAPTDGLADSGDFESADFSDEAGGGLEDFGDFDSDFDSSDFGDEFSMGDFGAEFGIMEDEAAEDFAEEEPASPEAEAMVEEALEEAAAEDQAADFAITDDQFSDLKSTLAYLPLNLKIAASEIIAGGKYDFEEILPLIEALYQRQPPRDIAKIVSKISGKKIEIPRGYEKRTGEHFEQERKSFAYQFSQTIWPVLRLVLAATGMLAAMLFLGYRFIYQPLFARNLYEQGLENIELQEYQQANRLFEQAYEIWPVNSRFLEYAEAFSDQRQFALAREKYETLLSDDIDPLNREGILRYADFAIYDLRDYPTAIEYLRRLLREDPWDYDARITQGDAYLEWGILTRDEDQRAEYFESARYEYASLIDRNGQSDELLFRMLRYFINTRNIEDALNLKDLFLTDERAQLDPRGMTELGGFLLDLSEEGIGGVGPGGGEELINQFVAGLRGDETVASLQEDALRVINRAMELDDTIPEVHYYRARYSRLTGDLQDEITALRNARELFEELELQRPLDRFETARKVDTYIREAENLYRLEEVLSAETRLRTAVQEYERALEARKVEASPMFGRAYALLGDIYYYEASNYDAAYQYFTQARENDYGRPDTHPELFRERQDLAYKLGFIALHRANNLDLRLEGARVELADQRDLMRQQALLDQAIREFNTAQGSIPTANINLLYARANTQFMRQNYFDAASLYRILLEELTAERRSISTFLLEEDQRHRALIDFQVRANNNLGVTLYRLYRQGGQNAEDLLAQSQLFLSRSAELSENLNRDVETAVRADARPLAFLNLTYILAPEFDDAVQIDPDIRKDLQAPTF